MKTTRSVLISLFVLIAVFFVFRSAEAAPRSPADWLQRGESASRNTDEEPYNQIAARIANAVQPVPQQDQLITLVEPAVKLPVVQQATDVIADLAVTIQDDPDPVFVDQNLTYTLVVTNATSGVTISNVVVTDILPATVNFVSATPTQGSGCNNQPPVVCNLGDIAGGNTAQVVIVVTPTEAGPITNSAEVASTDLEADPFPDNNSDTEITTVDPLADLSITKTGSPPSVAVGGTLQYTLQVSNAGPSAAAGVTVNDTLPAALTGISVTPGAPTCTLSGQGLSCALGTLASGGSTSVTISGVVASGTTPGTISNTATVTSATSDSDASNNSATAETTVTGVANLSITKTGSPPSVAVGGTLQYTLGVSNAGPSAAAGVTVNDTLPAALTGISVTPGAPTCTLSGQGLSCALGTLASGGSTSVTISGVVASGTTPGTISNTATVTSATSDSDASNNSATAETTVTGVANLSITKTGNPPSVAVGGTLQYTLGVSNAGPSAAAGVTVNDTLPAALGSITVLDQGTMSCGVAGHVVTCTQVSLASGGSTSVTIRGVVDTATTPGTISNTATIGSATSDSDGNNNSATELTTVTGVANLSITKTGNPPSVAVGGTLQYTLQVSNAGPSAAAGVTVNDTLPAALTGISVTPGAPTCTLSGQGLSCALGTLASGGSTSVTISGVVASGTTPGTISNTATVTSATSDSDASNNSATAETTVTGVANLSITKTGNPPSVAVGGTLQYTLQVSNAGPSAAAGVTVNDTLPAALTGISVTPGAPTCTLSGQGLSCALGTLASGGSTSVTISGVVASGTTPGTISNTATVTSATSDSDASNNSATAETTVTGVANLSITKTGNPPSVAVGGTLQYTLGVSNAGPSAAAGVTVNDTLPAALTGISVTPGAPTCTLSGQGLSCALGTLASGGSTSVTISGVVDTATTPGTISNTATVTSATSDSDASNNSATAETTVTGLANLSITNTASVDPVVAGNPLVYTLQVSNAGPSAAVGVTVADTLPAALTGISVTPGAPTCTLSGQALSCALGTLASGGSTSVTISGAVASGTAQGTVLSNTATVSATTSDPIPGNNTASTTTAVQVSADLRINKLDTVDPVVAGDGMSYTIVITNTGPSDAVGVRITDTLPVGVSYVTHVPTPEWICQIVSGELRCSRSAPVVASARLQIDVAVLVDSSVTSTLSNLVRVGSSTPDPLPANNTDTELTAVGPKSDLSIAKVESVDPVVAGTNLTYTLTVSNAGSSHAANLVVTDTLPANVTYQSYGGSSGWTCTLLAGNQLRCTRTSLNKNASSVISVTTKVKSSASGTLNNTAVVRSSWADPSLSDNSVTIGTTVIRSADMSVDVTDNPDPVAEDQTLTYKVVVKNNGPSDAASVSLTELIPSAAVTLVSAVPVPQGSCSGSGPVTCNLGSVVSGSVVTVTVTTTAKPVNNVAKSISNTATVTTTSQDSIPANDSMKIDTQVLPAADLQINLESFSGLVQTGQTMTYTLQIKNVGLSIAYNVVVTDTLPAEMTFKSSSILPASSSPKVVWNLGNLAKDQSVSFTLVVDVKSPTKALVNQVITKSSVWDVFPANSEDQVSVQAIDDVHPTAIWRLPVGAEGILQVFNLNVLLEVEAADNVAVAYVRFYRWDPVLFQFVEIGNDYAAGTCQYDPSHECYQWDLDTRVLRPKWNEIRVRAYDASGNPSPDGYRILLKFFGEQIFLPIARK